MISLSFREFYGARFEDESYELYKIRDEQYKLLYIGISRNSVWERWFGGLASHMQQDQNGSLRGNSIIGDVVAKRLPASWDWGVELWTKADCVRELLDAGVTEVDNLDVQRIGILRIEGYLIRTTCPLYNVLNAAERTMQAVTQDREESAVQLHLWSEASTSSAAPAVSGLKTIDEASADYQEATALSHSIHTTRTYANAVQAFTDMLRKKGVDPATTPVKCLDENSVLWFQAYLQAYSPSTEKLYLHAVIGLYEYLAAANLAAVNLSRVRLLLRPAARHSHAWDPSVPADDIAKLLDFAQSESMTSSADTQERLRAMRDRAFLLTLADTGLRVHEACKLRRGDVDWNEGQAVVIGKGDKQAIVRFSERSLRALRAYLDGRAALDGGSGKPLASLPLFARHDKGAGAKVKPITTATGRNIVHERVAQALGEGARGRITPHSLRHYFVTTVLRASGNLKLAQELARHTSIQVTQRYAHLSNDELDRGYHEIFNRNEGKARD